MLTLTVAGRAQSRLETVPQMIESDIAYVEQPVGADDLAGLREVRSLGVPVVADETVYSTADIARVVEAEAADVISIYVGKSGGTRTCWSRPHASRTRLGRCRHRGER